MRATRNSDGLRDPVKAIYQDDDVCRLGGSACAAGTKGDADIRSSKGWGVVDTVPHHHRGVQPPLHRDGIHLVGRHSIGQYGI
jgi:hypothetical protein